MEKILKYEIKELSDLYEIKGAWNKIEKGNDMTAFQAFDWNCLLFEKWKSDIYNRLFSKCYIYT